MSLKILKFVSTQPIEDTSVDWKTAKKAQDILFDGLKDFRLNGDSNQNHGQQPCQYSLHKLTDDEDESIESGFELNITDIIKRLEDDSELQSDGVEICLVNGASGDCDKIECESSQTSVKEEILKREILEIFPNLKSKVSPKKTKKESKVIKKLKKPKVLLWEEIEVKKDSNWFLPYIKKCEIRLSTSLINSQMYELVSIDALHVDTKRKSTAEENISRAQKKKLKLTDEQVVEQNNTKAFKSMKKKFEKHSKTLSKADSKTADFECLNQTKKKIEKFGKDKLKKKLKKNSKTKYKESNAFLNDSSDDEVFFSKALMTDNEPKYSHENFVVVSKSPSRKIKPIIISQQRPIKARKSKKVTFCSSIFIRRFVPEDDDLDD